MEDVDGARAGAELGEPVANRLGCDRRRAPGGVLQGLAAGQERRQAGRVGAAGAVRRLVPVALDGDGDVALAVEEPVHGLGSVPARDDHRRRAELVEGLGERAPVGVVGVRDPEQRAGLVQVRGHDRGQREELLDQDGDGVVLRGASRPTRRP